MNKIPKIAKEVLTFVKNKKNKAKEPPKGFCYKPRFAYIDNSAKGFLGKKGFDQSMFSDLLSVSPDKIFNILAGYSVDGSGLLPCIEYFENAKENLLRTVITFIIIFTIIYILIKHL